MAVYTIAAHIMVTLPPAQIWAVLDNFSGWPRWMPEFRGLHVDLLSKGTPRTGYRFRLRGRVAYAELRVVEYDAMRRGTRFRMNLPPLTGANYCTITRIDEQLYRIDRIDHVDLFGPVIKILDATQRDRFTRLSFDFLRALKNEAERQANERSKPT